jgi:hypothetical protein
MLSNPAFRLALGLLIAGQVALRAQSGRPEAPPFNPSLIDMQAPSPQGVAIRAGRLFDPKSGTNLTNQVIVVKGDRIADVGPADKIQIPQGARIIDLGRATVLPGLIDRHVHLMQEQQPNDGRAAFIGLNYALKDLNAGFTTLQDMGSAFTYATVELRDAINKGLVPGPRLQVAGPQINPRGTTYYAAPSVVTPFGMGPGSPVWQLAQNVNSPALARAAVREHSHYGTDWIKVYDTEDYEGGGYPQPEGAGAFLPNGRMINVPSLTLEEEQAIVDEAHRRGLKVACHAYGGEGLRNCLAAGVDLPMHVIVGVTGAEGSGESNPLGPDRRSGSERQKSHRRQDHSFPTHRTQLQKVSRRRGHGSVWQRRLYGRPRRAGISVRILRQVGDVARKCFAHGYEQCGRRSELRSGETNRQRGER